MNIYLYLSFCSLQKDLKCLIGVDQIVEEQYSISGMGSDKVQTYERTLCVWEMAMKPEGRQTQGRLHGHCVIPQAVVFKLEHIKIPWRAFINTDHWAPCPEVWILWVWDGEGREFCSF